MKKYFYSLFHDETGQASAEYTLVLAVVLGSLVLFIKDVLTPIYQRVTQLVTNSIQNVFIQADLHTFRVR